MKRWFRFRASSLLALTCCTLPTTMTEAATNSRFNINNHHHNDLIGTLIWGRCNRFERMTDSVIRRDRQAKSAATTATTTFEQLTTTTPILEIRGGAKKKGARTATLSSSQKQQQQQRSATGSRKVGTPAPKKSAVGSILTEFNKIQPLTRIYLALVVLTTTLGIGLGQEGAQALLALDPTRVLYGFEMWRPLTAAAYLGPPSIQLITSGYILFEYSSKLERAYGSAQFLIFLLVELVILSVWSALLGQPFFAISVVTAMLHVLSRSMPFQKANWLVLTVPYWCLPYVLMIGDMLQAQSAMAAVPHVMGILAGHFYFFHKFVWPKRGSGMDWLAAPDIIKRRLDPQFKTKMAAVASAAVKKGRTRGQGRKLGGT